MFFPWSRFTALTHHLLSFATRVRRYHRRGHRSWHWHTPCRFPLPSFLLHTPQPLIGHHPLSRGQAHDDLAVPSPAHRARPALPLVIGTPSRLKCLALSTRGGRNDA